MFAQQERGVAAQAMVEAGADSVAETPGAGRPPRPSLMRDLNWRLEAFAYDVAGALLRLLPVERASDVGAWLLRRLGPLTGAHRIARRNIALAFPDWSEAERAALLDAQWVQLGRSFAEFPLMDRLTPASGRIEVVGRERLTTLAEKHAPAVLVSGHLANWEVMAAVIVDAGVDCHVTYRAANNPYVDRRIIDSRARYGVRLFAPKGGEGSRELLAALARGESVALMNDQKFNGGVAAPFFGHEAHTAVGPTRLALRFTGALLPMSVRRLPGVRFRVTVHEPIALTKTGDRAADLRAGVEAMNAFMEARIREQPQDWFWVHKRWSSKAYESLARAPFPLEGGRVGDGGAAAYDASAAVLQDAIAPVASSAAPPPPAPPPSRGRGG